MRKEGTWAEFVTDLTASVRSRALSHINDGEIPTHAWRRAVRTEVMELEED